MSGRLPISFLSALAWSQLSSALVPADPTITQAPALFGRQNDADFIGWLSYSGSWTSQDCDAGATWYQNGKYAQCCPTSLASCYAPTACLSGSLIYPYSDISSTRTIGCAENYGTSSYSICNTAFIFENESDSNPKTDIVCGTAAENWSYYRKAPAEATQSPSSSSAPSSAQAQSTTAQPGATKAPDPPSPPPAKKKSKAWIAGAIVGPIVGLAIIGLIIFFLTRRKKSKTTPTQHGAAVAPGAPAGVQEYSESKPTFSPQGSYVQPSASPGYNPNVPYDQQGLQGSFSPAPQYVAPYTDAPPGSPPPQGAYAPEKQTYQHNAGATHPEAAELGGASSPVGGSHTAELSGDHAGPR